MGKLNCWEFKKCERQQGGTKTHELGVCPVATEIKVNGVHDGKNGGRCCWVIGGSLCGGKIQGTFAQKEENCLKCEFYKVVKTEEQGTFVMAGTIMKKLHEA